MLITKKHIITLISILSIIGYGYLAFAVINPGDTLDPVTSNPAECPTGPTDPTCIVTFPSGGSGWSLTGDVGTDDTLNFIGTTDAQDFVIRTNNAEIGRFGQRGNIALGSPNTLYGAMTPIASGDFAFALGYDTIASGVGSFAGGYGSLASNENSFAWGIFVQATSGGAVAFGQGGTASGLNSFTINEQNIASGPRSFAAGNATQATAFASVSLGQNTIASGELSFTQGRSTRAPSLTEAVFGLYNTLYTPIGGSGGSNSLDRLFTIANGTGTGTESDALTILKNGQTGIAIDNFEANTNGNIFQVGDGTTNIIGYVDNVTGNWMNVSDERKKTNIQDLHYGLDTINQLSPKSFDYIRNNESSIGFLAQDVLSIVPEAVSGNEDIGYGMSYATLTPVLVKAIQELDLKLENMQPSISFTSGFSFDTIRDWLGDKLNGINKLFVKELCLTDGIEEECITMDELRQLKQSSQISSSSNNSHSESSINSSNDNSENNEEVSDDMVVPEEILINDSEEIIISEESSEQIISDLPEETITESESESESGSINSSENPEIEQSDTDTE